MLRKILFIALFVGITNQVFCQDTIGLISNTKAAYQGYTLYSPFFTTKTYLLDMDGNIAHSWETGFLPGANENLLPDGNLLKACRIVNNDYRVAGKGGLIQIFDNKGVVKWTYKLIDDQVCQHHGILLLPNGNIIAILWQRFDKNQAIEMGRNPRLVDSDLYMLKLIEIKPMGQNEGEIVWEWNSIDHLIQDYDATKPNYGKVSEHPELIDINYVVRAHNKKDYLHTNSVDLDRKNDLLLVSVRAFDEIWIIDHSTQFDEVSNHKGGRFSKGGDLLFRWGNPEVFQSVEDTVQTLFGQHDAQWITQGKYKGNILIFNNGRDSIRPWSSVDIIASPSLESLSATMPHEARLLWRYQAAKKEVFYSTFLSGAQILPNGNMLITQGQAGRIFEIDSNKRIVWEFINPNYGSLKGNHKASNKPKRNYVYKAKRYGVEYEGIKKVMEANQGN